MKKSKGWWKEHYDNYLLSKLSIAAYSNKNNIKKSTFYSWIKKFRKEDTENDYTTNGKEKSIEKTKPTKVQWATIEPDATINNNIITNEKPGLKIKIGAGIIEITKDVSPTLLDLAVKVMINNA